MGGPTTALAVSKRMQEPTAPYGRGDKREPRESTRICPSLAWPAHAVGEAFTSLSLIFTTMRRHMGACTCVVTASVVVGPPIATPQAAGGASD